MKMNQSPSGIATQPPSRTISQSPTMAFSPSPTMSQSPTMTKTTLLSPTLSKSPRKTKNLSPLRSATATGPATKIRSPKMTKVPPVSHTPSGSSSSAQSQTEHIGKIKASVLITVTAVRSVVVELGGGFILACSFRCCSRNEEEPAE
jgi:hypothetical protein